MGCDSSQCGYAVLVDNQSIKSCNVLAMQGLVEKKLKQLNMLKPILNTQNYNRVLINITVYSADFVHGMIMGSIELLEKFNHPGRIQFENN